MSVPLIRPFKTALRTVNTITSTIVEIETESGLKGIGEAPPTGPITGESHLSVRGAIYDYMLPKLKGMDVNSIETTLHALHKSCIGNTSAKASIDMALYDLFGKHHNIPLFRLFGGHKNKIETNLTISIGTPEEMVAASLEAVERGFNILKIKIGLDYKLDIERIKAIREAVGPDVLIRLDANQGWNKREALIVMREIESTNIAIELLEQPLTAKDFQGMKEISNAIKTPVLADESVFSSSDAEKIINMRAADYINIKLMKCGGLKEGNNICSIAEANNIECFMGCMLETKIAVTAAAHLACGRRVINRCDLDSPSLCSSDPVDGGVTVDGPWLFLSEKPGLGISKVDGIIWD